jgi:hypothetical protein
MELRSAVERGDLAPAVRVQEEGEGGRREGVRQKSRTSPEILGGLCLTVVLRVGDACGLGLHERADLVELQWM